MFFHGCTLLHLGLIALFAVLCKGDEGPGVNIVINRIYTRLYLLHVVYHHGETTPKGFEFEIFPKYRHFNNTYSPYGLSALLDEGKQRLYEIGKFLRKHYDAFIYNEYLPDEVLVTSTDLEWTKMSARCCLSGLYATEKDQQWNCESAGQNVPINIGSPLENDMSNLMMHCPRLWEARKDILNTPEVQKKAATFNDMYAEINKHIDANISKPEHLYLLNNFLKSEKASGFPTPEWAVPYLGRLEEASNFEYETVSKSLDIKKIVAGTLLDTIIKNSQRRVNYTLRPYDRRVFMYSAQDFNVAGMLAACGVFKPHQPPFGATFILEVRRKMRANTYGIRILYMKDVKTGEPEVLTIPGCEELCPVEKFIKLTQEYTVGSTTEICKSQRIEIPHKNYKKEYDYFFKIDAID